MKQLRILSVAFLCLVAAAPSALADGPVKIRTVVIDPGHGGHDPGCVSSDGNTMEKSLALDISQKFADKIQETYPDVKVILTRGDDTYVTLSGRADVANNANADLFISIHINASRNTKANGYSVHVLGQSSREGNDLFSKNLDLCKRENSVIKLEDDYETRYQGFDPSDPQSYIFFSLLQNSNLSMSLAFAEDINNAMRHSPVRHSRGVSQDPFWVLWRTTMPAVLIECAFISNAEDLAVLQDEEDRGKIAGCFLQAFSTYKARYEGSASVLPAQPQPVQPAPAPAPQIDSVQTPPPPAQIDSVLYGTQIIATPKVLDPSDKFFQGYTPVTVPGEKWIKYVIGTSGNLEEARKNFEEIRKIFTDSFMVKIKENATERIR